MLLLFGKSLDHPKLLGMVYLTPQTMKRSNLPPELSKTVYFTPGQFWTAVATVTELYVHCVDLLMWSPIKLYFLFYDFSVIYYVF
jgi:hypothetical protein